MGPLIEFNTLLVLTVVVTRFALYVRPTASPTVFGLRLHHYMYGILLIVAGIALHFVPVYAIGWGLFIDELTFLIIRGKTHAENYSPASLIGTGIATLLAVCLSQFLLSPI